MEVWKDIKGYDGSYQVSDLGNVRSLDRITIDCKNLKGRMLKLNHNSNGYLTVSLYSLGKSKTHAVHRLVAESFLNSTPNGFKLVVDHIDNDKLNNKMINLQVITSRENLSKDKTGGTSKYTGVCFYKKTNKWLASFKYKNKSFHIGLFNTELEASEAYNNKLKEIILKESC